MGGFASSKILEVHGERMIKGTFDLGFRINLHQKDLNLALAGAKELGINLPNTAGTQQVFSTLHGNWWRQLGSLGADQGTGAYGEFLDSRELPVETP